MTMRSPRKRAIILSALAVAVIALAAVFALPAFTTVAFVDPLLVQTFQLKELGRQLLAASDNDGRFPAKLADLVPDYAPEDWPGLKFHDLRTKEPIDWTYFSGHSTHDPGDTILVASPKTFSGADGTRMVGAGAFRIVLSTDDRLALLTEADFQACIADQQRPEWSIRQEIPVTWNFFSKHSGPSFARHGELEARARKNSPANVPHLIRVLQTGSEFDRQDAATALGEIGPVAPEIVPALITALDVKPVGYWAAMALAEISLNDETVTPRLFETLQSGKREASYWAVVALEEIGTTDEAAVPLLIEALKSDSSDMRTAAAQAIAGIGTVAHSATPTLIEKLKEGDSWTVKCSIIALGRIGPDAHEAVPALAAYFDAGKTYKIDAARALWKIDAPQTARVVPALIAALESQRDPKGSNEFTDSFSAIDLLGEIGPEARAAIPILQLNLQGGAWMPAAWALWRIDPAFSDSVTPVLARFLAFNPQPDRLDRLSRVALSPRKDVFNTPFGPRLAAAGELWQMHPEKRDTLNPFIVALLREWASDKVLKKLSPETKAAIPALEEIESHSPLPKLRLLARAALRKIATTDYGSW